MIKYKVNQLVVLRSIVIQGNLHDRMFLVRTFDVKLCALTQRGNLKIIYPFFICLIMLIDIVNVKKGKKVTHQFVLKFYFC